MAIFIDPPRWPAHGTTFSHLVSDSSLSELHAFAREAGLPERAFDRDHYDVAARRYQELVALGARPVEGRELIRRLRASGLRVTSRERVAHAVTVLRHRWPAALGAAGSVREELLDRWSEPHRRYHGATHLLAVLARLDELTRPAPVPLTVALAAWFHDAVYAGLVADRPAGHRDDPGHHDDPARDDDPGLDEERSAVLAESLLRAHLAPADVAEVARLVRLTAGHQVADGDRHGALLCDADLAVLGADPPAYDRYVAAVREEYAAVDDAAWRAGWSRVLRHLLDLQPLYRTERARALWTASAHANLQRELASLVR